MQDCTQRAYDWCLDRFSEWLDQESFAMETDAFWRQFDEVDACDEYVRRLDERHAVHMYSQGQWQPPT